MAYERYFEVRYTPRTEPRVEFLSRFDSEQEARLRFEKFAEQKRIVSVELIEVIRLKLGTAFKV